MGGVYITCTDQLIWDTHMQLTHFWTVGKSQYISNPISIYLTDRDQVHTKSRKLSKHHCMKLTHSGADSAGMRSYTQESALHKTPTTTRGLRTPPLGPTTELSQRSRCLLRSYRPKSRSWNRKRNSQVKEREGATLEPSGGRCFVNSRPHRA